MRGIISMKEKESKAALEVFVPLETQPARSPGRPKGSRNLVNIKGRAYKLTPQVIKKFLKRLEKTGNVGSAAAFVGVSRDAIYKRMSVDEGFAEHVERAKGRFLDMIEQAAVERAIDGTNEPVYHQGKLVGYKKKYSDKMLDKLMTAADKERYGQHTTNHTTIDQNINVNSQESAKEKLANFFGLKDVTPKPEALEHIDSSDADCNEGCID